MHPATLRRWADAEEIDSSRTPGGHRRFRRQDVEAYLNSHRRLRRTGGLEGLWATEAQRSIRLRRPFDLRTELPFDAADRATFRESGTHLLTAMVEASRGDRDPRELSREARSLGRAYASWSRRKGVSSGEVLRALHLVHRTLIDAALRLLETENLGPSPIRALLDRLEPPLEEIEAGFLEGVLAHEDS